MSDKKFNEIVWKTIDTHIQAYQEMVDERERRMTRNSSWHEQIMYMVAKERLNALRDVKDAIFRKWTDIFLEDIPEDMRGPYLCRCVVPDFKEAEEK